MPKGGGPQTREPACNPVRLWLDSTEALAATDYGGGSLYAIDSFNIQTQTLSSVIRDSTGTIGAIAADDANVYFAALSGPSLSVVSKGGGTPQVLVPNQGVVEDIAVGESALYWVTDTGTVMALPLPADPDAAAPRVLASKQSAPSALTVDSSQVYWTNNGAGTVMMVPQSGGTATPLATGQMHPSAIAVDSSGVYWTTQDGNVMVVRPLP